MTAKESIDIINNPIASEQGTNFQKPQSDSTSASFGEEALKLFSENNNNNKLNLKNNINNKKNMELQSINYDIFPKERQGGSSNYFNLELNMNNDIQINTNPNSPENKLGNNKDLIFVNDIPEMILYKYNYDINLYKESLKDIENEVEWMYSYLNMGKCEKKNLAENEIKLCLKNLLNRHKVEKLDIPYIIANCEDVYKKYFGQSEVFDILSVYDVEFLRLQKKRKKILIFYEYIQNDKRDLGLGKVIDTYYLPKKYILEAKTDLELDLIEALLGILTYVSQSNELDENFKNMINVEVLQNLNIDYSLLNKVKDDKLDDIIKQFCLYPEQVVHNLKVLNGEINDKMIEPPFPGCPLNDLCKKALVETAGKYATTKDILMTSFQYYNLILSLNPYIFKLIYQNLYDIYSLSTEPTEKGKEILNSLHPSYHCKRINKMPIKYFFEEKNQKLCNIYTKNFGEIFLDIEKCANNGLIKYTLNIPETAEEIPNLKNLISKACNGLRNDKMEIEDNKISNDTILKKKYNGARNLCIENLIIISKGFFLNVIKKKLRNYSEKSLIKKISSEFFNIISRNFLGKLNIDNSNTFSIIFNSQKNNFRLLCLSSNFQIMHNIELNYVWKNDNILEQGLTIALNLSDEQAKFKNLLKEYRPKVIVIDVSNLESYKMINFIRSKFRDYYLVYSDYISLIDKLKPYQMAEEMECKAAIEQVRYVINPVNQIIDLWRYKYEDNLLLNLSLHPLQDSIVDISLLCYSLENQVIRVVNSKGIYLKELAKYSYNLFNFVSGLGINTSPLLIESIRNYEEILRRFRQTCPIIYKNMEIVLIENKSFQPDIYKIKNDIKEENGLMKSDIFSAMIKDKIYFKNNILCNAIVSGIDYMNKTINCYLLRGDNTIKALLPFNNIDPYIKDLKKYFYPQRIILCKVIQIILRHNSYEVFLSNRNDLLISVKDFFLEQNNNNAKVDPKYTIIEEEDFIIKDIQRLKEIQRVDSEKEQEQKKLKYLLITLENELILRNVTCNNMKRINKMDYTIRPSFRGDNFLILSFYLIDDIYLNYDIEILTRQEQNEESTNTITEYKLGHNTYNSLTELVNKFASKMKYTIDNFRKNDYFKKPEEIHELITKIFGIENPVKVDKDNIEIKNKKKEFGNEKTKTNVMNVIIFGFMKEEPDYGIILTKTSDEINYTVDFIKFVYNGYLFHGVLYGNLNEIIFFLKEKRKTSQYQNFLKNQFICTTHQQIEEIDEQYTEFEGIDPNLEKYNMSNISYNDLNSLKSNLLINDSDNANNNSLLGKKRNHDNGWGNQIDENNNTTDNAWGKPDDKNIEENGWGIKTEDKTENDLWGDIQNKDNKKDKKDDPWAVSNNQNETANNFSGWDNNDNNNNGWPDESANNNNNNSGNSGWNNSNNYKWQNNKFNNKRSFSKGNNKKFDKHNSNGFNNKNKKWNNNKNNKNNNFENKKKESNFTWDNNINNEQNDNEPQSNFDWNNTNNNNDKNNDNNNNDYWGSDANNNKNINNNNNGTYDNWGGDNNANEWNSDNNANDNWGDKEENKNKNNINSSVNSWGDNFINISHDDNNNGWGNDTKNNKFNSDNRNNNDFNKNNHNNNGKRNFSHNRNNNNKKNNFNEKKNNNNNNNKGGYSSNWGSNNYQNNKNKFSFKGKKNEKRWANELNKTNGDAEIKQEKDEGVVDFENYEGFGGYANTDNNKEE